MNKWEAMEKLDRVRSVLEEMPEDYDVRLISVWADAYERPDVDILLDVGGGRPQQPVSRHEYDGVTMCHCVHHGVKYYWRETDG